MRMRTILLGLSLCLATVPAWAQPADTQPAAREWNKLTGDWGGARTELADKGITFDLDITNIMQGNAHGGADTNDGLRYSGSADMTLTLDTGKMGLWPGGQFILVGEPTWGNGVDAKVGSLIPVNFDAAVTGADDGCSMYFSEWIYQQMLLDGKLILIGGKLFGARAFDRNVFANDERTQFMNTAFRNTVMIPTFLPYTTLGVGAIVNPTDWLSIMTAVADTDGEVGTTGFNTAFHGDTNTTLIHEWSFTIKPFEQTGHQRLGFVWSCKNFDKVAPPWLFDRTSTPVIKLLGPKLAQKVISTVADFDQSGNNVLAYYNFDQYLFTEQDDPTQGVGVFGRVAWARQDVNPATHFYSMGVGGKGILPTRDQDTFGVGYYFLDLSNDLPDIFHSEQGVECYYNIQVTPWLHISPDLQVIVDPGGTNQQDVSIVYGLRMQVNL